MESKLNDKIFCKYFSTNFVNLCKIFIDVNKITYKFKFIFVYSNTNIYY